MGIHEDYNRLEDYAETIEDKLQEANHDKTDLLVICDCLVEMVERKGTFTKDDLLEIKYLKEAIEKYRS